MARRHRLALVTCWLAHDPALRSVGEAAAVRELLTATLPPLAELIPGERFVADPDRREELACLTLRGFGIVPEGESVEQAADRLATLDTVRRHQVLEEARRAEERAQQVREAMARKRAEEAAQRYSHV